MRFTVTDISAEIEKELDDIASYFEREFGCNCTLSKELPSNSVAIALDITLPEDKQIFMPIAHDVKLFRIDTKKQVMTIIFTPD